MDIFDQLEQEQQGINRPTAMPSDTIGGDIFDQIEAQQLPQGPVYEAPEPQKLPEPVISVEDIKPYVRPTLEIGGSIGGSIAGAPAGGPGIVGGGTLGYAAGRKLADIVLGENSELVRPLLEGTGMTVGSVYGTAVGGPPGGVKGGSLGYAAGKNIADLVLGEDYPDGIVDSLYKAGEDVYKGLQLEAWGLVGGKALTAIGRTLLRGGEIAKKAPELIAKQIKRLTSAKKLGVPITVGEGMDSTALLTAEDFFRSLATPRYVKGMKFAKFDESGFRTLLKARENLIHKTSKRIDPNDIPKIEKLGVRIQKKLDELFAGKVNLQGEAMDKLRDEALQHYGSSESIATLRKTGQEILEGKQSYLDDLTQRWFARAKRFLPSGGADDISTKHAVKAISAAIKEADNLAESEREPVLRALRKLMNDYTTVTAAIPPSGLLTAQGTPVPGIAAARKANITYDQLLGRRKGLGKLIRSLEKSEGIPGEPELVTGGADIARLFKPILKAADDDLGAFGAKSGTDVYDFVKLGLSTSKRKFDFVKNPTVKRLIRSRPEQFHDILLKPDQTTTSELIVKELKANDLKPLRSSTIEYLLNAGSDEPLTALALKKNLKKAGERNLRTLLGNERYEGLLDLQQKLMAHERRIARIQLSGSIPKELGLSESDLMSNKFFRQIVRNQKPEKIGSYIYRPGNERNIKRVYSALRAAGQHQKVNDLKASFIADVLPVDPKTNYIDLEQAHKAIKSYGETTLKAALEKEGYAGFKDIDNVIQLISRRKEHTPSIFREIVTLGIALKSYGAPATLPWIYLRADGRNQLKKLLKLSISEATYEQKNAALTKLIAIGVRAAREAQKREEAKYAGRSQEGNR